MKSLNMKWMKKYELSEEMNEMFTCSIQTNDHSAEVVRESSLYLYNEREWSPVKLITQSYDRHFHFQKVAI